MKQTIVAVAVHQACMRLVVDHLVRKIKAEELERKA